MTNQWKPVGSGPTKRELELSAFTSDLHEATQRFWSRIHQNHQELVVGGRSFHKRSLRRHVTKCCEHGGRKKKTPLSKSTTTEDKSGLKCTSMCRWLLSANGKRLLCMRREGIAAYECTIKCRSSNEYTLVISTSRSGDTPTRYFDTTSIIRRPRPGLVSYDGDERVNRNL